MGILAITKKLIKRIILILPSGEVLLKRIVELRKANQLPSPAIEANKQLLIDPPNDLKKIFTSHYLNNIWGSEESVSGLGSTLEYTSHIREEIPKLLEFYKIKVLLDAPCGDYNWFQTLNRPADVKYIGGDIVEELVIQNQIKYSNSNTKFIHLDITSNPLPPADLWLCRDCLFHFSYEDIFKTISNFLKSDIKYILTSIHTECTQNTDISTGDARQLNLELFPFLFPKPILYMKDWIPGFTVRSLGLWTKPMIVDCMASNSVIRKSNN